MRSPARPNLIVVLVLALLASLGAASAWADSRTDARTHYQSGLKLYNAGDYKSAIREFSAAQSLAPADLNSYNLALCYDKLGNADDAIASYKAYLGAVPDAAKRGEIEASIARLQAAQQSMSKKATDAKAAQAVDDAKVAQAAADAKAAQAAQAAADAAAAKKSGPAEEAPPDSSTPPATGPVTGGAIGTPATGQVVTGDSQLDRVASINIDQIRDQRLGTTSGGIAMGANAAVGPNGPNGPNAQPPGSPANPNAPKGAADFGAAPAEAPKATPLYKKWWFWVVIAVGAYVVYEIATDSSSSNNNTSRELSGSGPNGIRNTASAGGLTLLHF